MATTYPLPTLACTITSTGITAPSYADIYQSLQASFQGIFGSDAYVDPDSQDGQMLAIVAKAIADSNAVSIAVYNAYSPATAQGVALSNAIKINGIARGIATSSTALVRIVGEIGTQINNGVVGGPDNSRWTLPALVTIPPAAFIDVTATCTLEGSTEAAIGTLTRILTPTLGWQSVTNAAAAAPGAPVELDATVRQRQTTSTALPSLTVLDGIVGAVAAIAGVTQVKAFENDTNATDSNGLPAHSIALVTLGGASADIANAIYLKKTPGAYTYGTTVVPVTDSFGIINTIRYFIATNVAIKAQLTIKALTGYTSSIGDQIKQSMVDYGNALGINKRVDIGRLYLPAQLNGQQGFETYEVNLIQIAIVPAAVGSVDIEIAFNQRSTWQLSDISLVVT
jgi:uncharacterized phage protein gp47/JayE